MSWIKKSVTTEIGLYIMLAIFVIFAIYYFFLNIQLRGYLEQQSKEQLLSNSKYISSEIETYLQKYITIVEQSKSNPDFINIAKETDELNKKNDNPLFNRVTMQLQDIAKLDKNISMSYIAISKANDLVTNIEDYHLVPNYELSSRKWYTSIIENGGVTVTDPYLDLVTEKMTVTVATPIKDNGEILGVFALDITIEDMRNMMRNYKIGESGYAVLVYNNGLIMSHPDFESTESVYLQDVLDKNVDELLSGNRGITTCKYNGVEKFVAYMPIDNTKLIVLTAIPKSEVFSELVSFLITNMLVLIGVIALAFFIMTALKNLISTPVVRISRELESYGTNRNSVMLPEKYLEREDEIGILTRRLSMMMQEISSYVLELEAKNTELIKARDEIGIERSLFKTTIHSLADGVISTNNKGEIRVMNNVAEILTGWTAKEANGQYLARILNIKNKSEMAKFHDEVFKIGHVVSYEDIILYKKNDDEILVEGSAAPIKDEEDTISGAVIVFRDFTEKKQRQEQILYLSYHDQLTGLYNRRFFEEEIKRLDAEDKLPLSIAMVDVNGLKLTNDAFGHMVGDELLIRVANILLAECRKTDVVARIGGDEFIVLLPNTTDKETNKIINRIYKSIEAEKIDNIIISISVGCDTKWKDDELVEDVINKAEEQMYMKKLTESKSMRNKTIQAILGTLREKNERERIHSERVSKISKEIAVMMDFDDETIREIEYAGLMHDIGKITVNSNILDKPAKLTDSEYQEIKRHTESGYQILRSVDSYTSLAEIALSHHERWDGSGYPRGLTGEEIPLIARIIAVADSYEAMTANRPYKEAMSKEQAVEELVRNSGTQFDPEIVKVMVEKILNSDGLKDN